LAASLHYLTVQDILWINLQVTKKVHHFSYAKLEEATYYQYAYGESKTLVPQAARFLSGFMRLHPFDAGNEATAFVGCLSFLRLNGTDTELRDEAGAEWFAKASRQRDEARGALESIARSHAGGHHETLQVRDAISDVLDLYPCTVLDLLSGARVA
jgi:prophage maintenance system killer protein